RIAATPSTRPIIVPRSKAHPPSPRARTPPRQCFIGPPYWPLKPAARTPPATRLALCGFGAILAPRVTHRSGVPDRFRRLFDAEGPPREAHRSGAARRKRVLEAQEVEEIVGARLVAVGICGASG